MKGVTRGAEPANIATNHVFREPQLDGFRHFLYDILETATIRYIIIAAYVKIASRTITLIMGTVSTEKWRIDKFAPVAPSVTLKIDSDRHGKEPAQVQLSHK